MNKNRNLILLIVLLLSCTCAFAMPLTFTGATDGAKVYNEAGKRSADAKGLDEGWIIKTGSSSVSMTSLAGNITVKANSLMTVGKINTTTPFVYLLDGSAEFETEENSLPITVYTPSTAYFLGQSSRLLAISTKDFEAGYAIKGEIKSVNAITGASTVLKPLTYVDMSVSGFLPAPATEEDFESAITNAPRKYDIKVGSIVLAASLLDGQARITFPGYITHEQINNAAIAAVKAFNLDTKQVSYIYPTDNSVTINYPASISDEAAVKQFTEALDAYVTSYLALLEKPAVKEEVKVVEEVVVVEEIAQPRQLTANAAGIELAVQVTSDKDISTALISYPKTVKDALVQDFVQFAAVKLGLYQPQFNFAIQESGVAVGVYPASISDALLISSLEETAQAYVESIKPEARQLEANAAGIKLAVQVTSDKDISTALISYPKTVKDALVQDFVQFAAVKLGLYQPEFNFAIQESGVAVGVYPASISDALLISSLEETAQAYLDSLKQEAEVTTPVPQIVETIVEPAKEISVAVEEPVVAEVVPVVAEVLPKVLSEEQPVVINYGAKIKASYDQENGFVVSLMPFFSRNSLMVALKADLRLEDGRHQKTFKFDNSSKKALTNSLTNLIGEVQYGAPSSLVYAFANRSTNYNFQHVAFSSLSHEFDSKDKLAFYNSLNTDNFDYQIFFDDISLSSALAGKRQYAGLRASYTPGKFTASISMVALTGLNKANTDLYPSLEASYPIVGNPKMKLEANASFTIKNLSFKTFAIQGGINAQFKAFSLGLSAVANKGARFSSVINNAPSQMLLTGSSIDIILSGDFNLNGFWADAYWDVPFAVKQASKLVYSSSVSQDLFTFRLGYKADNWEISGGVNYIGLAGKAITLLKNFNGSNIKTIIDPSLGTFFAKASYTAGPASMFFGTKLVNTSHGKALAFSLGATLELSKETFTASMEEEDNPEAKEEKSKIKVSAQTGYANIYGLKNILVIKPEVEFNFSKISFVLAPQFSIDGNDSSLALVRGEKQFSFGSGKVGKIHKLYDFASDLMSLVGSFSIGKASEAFWLNIDRDSNVKPYMSALVGDLVSNVDAPLYASLGMYAKYRTGLIGAEVYANDLQNPSLLGLSLDVTPGLKWPFTISVGAIFDASASNGANYSFTAYPELNAEIPLYFSGSNKVSIKANVATALHFGKENSVKTNDLKVLNNFVADIQAEIKMKNFGLLLTGGMQKGKPSYRMFDWAYNRTGAINLEGNYGRLFGAGEISFNIGKYVKAEGGYILPYNFGTKAFDWTNDRFWGKVGVEVGMVSFEASYMRQDFLHSAKQAILDKTYSKKALILENTVLSAGATLTVNNISLEGFLGTVGLYTTNGSLNARQAFTTKPILGFSAKISL